MNLLQETLSALRYIGKTHKDVLWIGCESFYFSWNVFEKLADTTYDSGYGAQEVASNLIVVGSDFWLERSEYDGSEGWEFKQFPIKPYKRRNPTALTVHQANDKHV